MVVYEQDVVIYRRRHKRGLEQNCLPLILTTAVTPAVKPAQNTVETQRCIFRPAENKQIFV